MMHIFHDWEFVQTRGQVVPKRGPFDPTPEHRRTILVWKYICCQCGKTKETYGQEI